MACFEHIKMSKFKIWIDKLIKCKIKLKKEVNRNYDILKNENFTIEFVFYEEFVLIYVLFKYDSYSNSKFFCFSYIKLFKWGLIFLNYNKF